MYVKELACLAKRRRRNPSRRFTGSGNVRPQMQVADTHQTQYSTENLAWQAGICHITRLKRQRSFYTMSTFQQKNLSLIQVYENTQVASIHSSIARAATTSSSNKLNARPHLFAPPCD
ncbi:hypothetical protein FG05_35056 [Fusarium graminearum]|nr:hypothetical protein FG05_35056 [Fusarium graminearum]